MYIYIIRFYCEWINCKKYFLLDPNMYISPHENLFQSACKLSPAYGTLSHDCTPINLKIFVPAFLV